MNERLTIEQEKERFAVDFEYWCKKCVTISDKMTGAMIPFVLNEPQRRLLAVLEGQRLAGKPIRVLLLKARQWGGSTLVQIYIAWFQIVLFRGRNSVIIGHKRNSSSNIKAMLRHVVEHYPACYLDDVDEPMQLVGDRDAQDVQLITQRDCKVILTSSFSPDAARGYNLSFAHLSEVAFWADNKNVDPGDLVRSVTGSIPLAANTIVVLESTANGNNSFFYNEWQRAVAGKSVYTPFFVGWQDIDLYQMPCPADFEPDEYGQTLLDRGLSLEQVYWCHCKETEMGDRIRRMAEFPTTPDEAFSATTHAVFTDEEKSLIMSNVSQPAMQRGTLQVWQHARPGEKYMAMLTLGNDIGEEKSPTVLSLWSIVEKNKPRLVAQLAETMSLDTMASVVLPLCEDYNRALLIVAKDMMSGKVFDIGKEEFVLQQDLTGYKNLYRNRKNGQRFIVMDRERYSLMFYELIFAERNGMIIDHDGEACRAVSDIVLHTNQKFYVSHNSDFNLVLNRAQLLYVWRELNAMKMHTFTREEINDLLQTSRVFF